MWARDFKWASFGFGFPLFFYFRRRFWPRRETYLRYLQDYRDELKEELEAVEKEIEELSRRGEKE